MKRLKKFETFNIIYDDIECLYKIPCLETLYSDGLSDEQIE